MRRIDLADAGFLYLEKRQTPMHVGGLHLFTLPEGADEAEFLAELMAVLKTEEEYKPPFGEFVKTGRAGPLGPLYWEKDRSFDIDYHVRHSALPQPGRYRELFMLISRLHSTLLDRNRPLWETHLIEGLENRQFALYMKSHHAATDGMGAMHMVNSMYSTRKSDKAQHSPLSLQAYEAYKATRLGERPRQRVVPRERELRNVVGALREQFDTTANLLGAFRQFGGAFFGRSGDLSVPWHDVPRTAMNAEVSGARRFVAQTWDMERIKAVGKAADATINDIVLAMCGGALRSYLLATNDLPKKSLKAMTPVSLRADDDLDSSNAVGFIAADLATNVKNPEGRLRQIQNSMQAGKALMQSLTRREAMLFSQITQVPVLLTSVLGLANRLPAFSTVISNVPGPREPLYWNGASLEGMYPASIVFDGFAMNFTLVSYNRQLQFGIVACRRSIPQVQRIIDYLEDALVELEEVAGLVRKPARKAARKTSAAPRKSAASKKTRSKRKTPATKSASQAKRKSAAKAKPAAKAKSAAKKPKTSTRVKRKPKAKARPKNASAG